MHYELMWCNRFGLYAAVYTKDIDRALRFAKGLESGTVGVNCTSPVTAAGTFSSPSAVCMCCTDEDRHALRRLQE